MLRFYCLAVICVVLLGLCWCSMIRMLFLGEGTLLHFGNGVVRCNPWREGLISKVHSRYSVVGPFLVISRLWDVFS